MRWFSYQRAAKPKKPPASMQLAAAYAVCRSVSRASAKNFYYSFLALPREKRDAICAVYAFMRYADDISDDPGIGSAEKREKLAKWLEGLYRAIAGEPTDDAVLLALADTQRRYQIPVILLEKLVAGTAMDLEEEEPAFPVSRYPYPSEFAADALNAGEPGSRPSGTATTGGREMADGNREGEGLTARYETFTDLYQYCYHVASVVGLVCIRIFGYQDPAAEPLAEKCGVAFQLTNIIRDVKEDAAMGRVYLPREDLAHFECSPADLAGNHSQAELAAHFRPLLEFEGQRARELYHAADDLLPLIDEDGRPALWVLVTIYRRLLDKITACHYDVFSAKVRLTTFEKLQVLTKGIWLRLRLRAPGLPRS